MTTTVAQFIDRTLRTYLEPPDTQGPEAILGSSITASGNTFAITQFQVPEDKDLMRQGLIMEIGSELLRGTSWTDPNAIVTRGVMDTTAVAHTVGDSIKLAPAFPRQTIFEAIQSNVISVGHRLYTVATEYVSTTAGGAGPLNDYAVSDVRFVPDGNDDHEIPVRIVDHHPNVNGRAFIVDRGFVGTGYLTYRKRMATPTAETDTMEGLGIEPAWFTMLMVGVAADLLIGRDIPQTQQDFIGKALEAEGVPVSTRANIGFAMRRYFKDMMEDFATEMNQEYGITLSMRDPFAQAGA